MTTPNRQQNDESIPPNTTHAGYHSLFDLTGRVALITGAGRGIGRSCALAIAQAGAAVWLIDRNPNELEDTVAEIRGLGGTAHPAVCDVTDTRAIRNLIAEIPILDILVNNAGTNIPEPFVDVSDENLDMLISLNVRATFVVAQAAAQKMLEHPDRVNRGGAIVNMSSQWGHVGATLRTVYCMAKHAMEGLTKASALELAPCGIRVVSIAPTVIETPLVASRIATPEAAERVISSIPVGRIGKPEEVAAAVVFAASPAASLITGTGILVDGGFTAR